MRSPDAMSSGKSRMQGVGITGNSISRVNSEAVCSALNQLLYLFPAVSSGNVIFGCSSLFAEPLFMSILPEALSSICNAAAACDCRLTCLFAQFVERQAPSPLGRLFLINSGPDGTCGIPAGGAAQKASSDVHPVDCRKLAHPLFVHQRADVLKPGALADHRRSIAAWSLSGASSSAF